ncbi:MAG: helix-turn-helix domain-containing protein [Lachnospiraceae bacterium]|nr:helix-turn-helix domain-containing protein [Lachnospiraceae bacterium]
MYQAYGQADHIRLRKNDHVSTHTLDLLCHILDCQLSDIVEYKKTEEDLYCLTH